MLDETLASLDYHLRHALVVFRLLIEGGIDDFHVIAHDGLPDIRHLLRPLVDQKDDDVHLRVVVNDGLGHLF